MCDCRPPIKIHFQIVNTIDRINLLHINNSTHRIDYIIIMVYTIYQNYVVVGCAKRNGHPYSINNMVIINFVYLHIANQYK